MAAAVEETQHHALARHRRHHGGADIELTGLEAQADPPVLRPAAFGDVEVGEELDARDDGVLQLRRRLGCRGQYAVEAVARDEAVRRRLEVDVAGASVVRVAHEQVDVADDRRLVGEVADIGVEIVGVGAFVARNVDVAVGGGDGALDVGGELRLGHWELSHRRAVEDRKVLDPRSDDVRADGDRLA